MADQSTRTEASLIAELNDLLQLDHDAVQAYTAAIEKLQSAEYRETLTRFRGDHERHIEELTRLVRERGGTPIELAHIPTGFFKLAVQKVGTAGGDREILLAFKSNERQVRDKYRRHAQRAAPGAVAEVLRRNAEDEATHYSWVLMTLEDLGAGPDTAVGRAEEAFEKVHGGAADLMESAERRIMEKAEEVRRAAPERARELGDRLRRGASGGLERAAHGVDRLGSRAEQRGDGGARVGQAAHQVADGLESAARYMRSQELSAMRQDVERAVDRNPIGALFVAVAAGFVLGRLLR